MKISVNYKITEKESNRVIFQSGTKFDTTEDTTCGVFKQMIVDFIPMLKIYGIDSLTITDGIKTFEDSDVIKTTSGLKCTIVVVDTESKGIAKGIVSKK